MYLYVKVYCILYQVEFRTIQMTRKSNRTQARRTRTRTLAEILEEESNQRVRQPPLLPPPPPPAQGQPHSHLQQQPLQQHPPPQLQQQRRQFENQLHRILVLLEKLHDEIQQRQQSVISQHEQDVLELEQHINMQASIGAESLRSVEQVRQFSRRRHQRDGHVIRSCQDFLQQIINLKDVFREAHLEREASADLRRRRHRIQSQLHILLDSILHLNQQFYVNLEEYLDRVLYQVMQYASAMEQESQEIQEWVQSLRTDPDIIDSLARYSKQFGHVYRSSHGRVMESTITSSIVKECTDSTSEMGYSRNKCDINIKSIPLRLVIDFGNDEMEPTEEKNACCIICLMDYQNGDDICRNAAKEVSSVDVTPCNHFFHKGCISQWLQTSSSHYHRRTSCPCCRNYFSIHDEATT